MISRKSKGKKKLINDIYLKSILERKICINICEVEDNLVLLLENKLSKNYQGKCVVEGFLKSDSIKLINYSPPIINGDNLIFTVLFECLLCYPVEGMIIKCFAKNITKAGIRAEIDDNENPVIIFIARDHNYNNEKFSEIKEGDKINVRIIGQRYEINDKFISVIAELVN